MSLNEPTKNKGKTPQRETSETSQEGKYYEGFENFKKKQKPFEIYPFKIRKLNEVNARNWFHKMEDELNNQNAWIAIEICRKVGIESFLEKRERDDSLRMLDLKASNMIKKGLDYETTSDLWGLHTAMQKWDFLKEKYLRGINFRKSMKFMELADFANIDRERDLVKGWYEFKGIMEEFIEMHGDTSVDLMEIGMVWYLWALPPELNHVRDMILSADNIKEEGFIRRLDNQDALITRTPCIK